MAQKDRRKLLLTTALFCAFAVACPASRAQATEGEEESEQIKQVEQNIAKERQKSPVIIITEQVEKAIPKVVIPEGPTMVTDVEVYGSTLLADEAVEALKARYANRELSARQIQSAVDRVNRAYRREGYITSYAYLNSDRLAEGILEIQVKEGRIGRIIIQGNQHFSEKVLRKKLTQKEGDLFNFRQLNKDLFVINKHQDRKANLKIEPNAETGTADIIIDVKDQTPFHVTLQADNYGSEYIEYRRYKTFFTFNNVTGNDDSLQIKLQETEGDAHKLFDFDYYYPINNDWKFNFYIMPFKKENYKHGDNATDDYEKHAWKWYFWFKNYLINQPGCEFVSSYGFVYKQINWYQFGSRQAEDHFRSVQWQVDLNRADKKGRWVVSNLLEKGIPKFLGGADRKDDITSVESAGGGYTREHLTVARRQNLVNDIDLLLKAHYQLSSQTLTGVNVFSMGGFMGVIDNRGYPRAQFPGDSGRSLTGALSIPFYGISRTATVPGSKTKLYDSLRWFPFIDYAVGVLKSPKLGDDKVNTLTSAGVGAVFTVPDQNLSMRLDIGWPVTEEKTKDGDRPHIWWAITKGF